MTATAVNSAVKATIVEGHKVWTQALEIAKDGPPDLLAYEHERMLEDCLRAIGRETMMTTTEIAARYERWVEGPFSCTLDPDVPEDGEPRYLPLADPRVRYVRYRQHWKPRRYPLAGAVYVARQPIAGEEFSVDGLRLAFDAIVAAHGDYPQELRVNHEHYTDYLNAMDDLIPRWGILGLVNVGRARDEPVVRATFNGIPITPQPRAPLLTLLAVYPLPGAGE